MKNFIVALCVAGMMSSCSDIDDNIANDAKSSIPPYTTRVCKYCTRFSTRDDAR